VNVIESVLSFWSREFGGGEHSASHVAARASPAFMKVLLQVAADPTGTRVNPMLLDLWLRDIAGRPIGEHVLWSRGDNGRTLWRVERGPEDIAVCSDCPAPEAAKAVLPSDAPPAELLAANLIKALRRQTELLELPIDLNDPKTNRLIVDVANQTVNAVVRTQEAILAVKRDEEHDRAIEALFEERQQKALLAIEKMGQGASSKGRAD
jgi:hypothetical protein